MTRRIVLHHGRQKVVEELRALISDTEEARRELGLDEEELLLRAFRKGAPSRR